MFSSMWKLRFGLPYMRKVCVGIVSCIELRLSASVGPRARCHGATGYMALWPKPGATPQAWPRVIPPNAVLLCGRRLPAQAQGARAVASGARNGDYIVAVINSELVTAFELEQRLARTRADAQRSNTRLPPEDQLRQQVLDALIDERVQSTYARENGPKIDDQELERAMRLLDDGR